MSENKQGIFRPIASFWHSIGWTGVDLFFVLSGFLIGGLLFKEYQQRGHLDVGRFLIRRGFKIWPGYFAFLAYLFVSSRIGIQHDVTSLAPSLLHLQNYLGTPRVHTWSLAVEEHFYLGLPLLLVGLFALQRRLRNHSLVPVACVAGIIACVATRILTNIHRPFSQWTHVYPTHIRIDGLLFGVLLAYMAHFHPARLQWIPKWRAPLILLGLVPMMCMAFMPISHVFVWTIGFTLLSLGFGALLLALVLEPSPDTFVGRAMATSVSRLVAGVGFYSFSIYLWHIDLGLKPAGMLVRPLMGRIFPAGFQWPVSVLVGVPVACGMGILMGRLIEWPALALRDRLFPAVVPALPAEHAVTTADASAEAVIRHDPELVDSDNALRTETVAAASVE